tara:strand:- start:4013 stop:4270 length:258 start_codon:yes stop_codon:yes gene_type:complete
MAKIIPDEELVIQRANARRRERIKHLFSHEATIREDAVAALKEAWEFDIPSFRLDELASMPTQAANLAAMRRDSIKEVITWLAKV